MEQRLKLTRRWLLKAIAWTSVTRSNLCLKSTTSLYPELDLSVVYLNGSSDTHDVWRASRKKRRVQMKTGGITAF